MDGWKNIVCLDQKRFGGKRVMDRVGGWVSDLGLRISRDCEGKKNGE